MLYSAGPASKGDTMNAMSAPERAPRQSEDTEYGAYAQAEEGKSLLK